MRPAALSSNSGVFGLLLALLVTVLMTSAAGCALFALEPPCRSDDNCEGARRCHAETGVCVDAAPASDAGSDTDLKDAGAEDAGTDTDLTDAG